MRESGAMSAASRRGQRIQREPSRCQAAAPDQLRRLASGCGVLPVARQTPAHSPRVGVLRARKGRSDLPLGRVTAEEPPLLGSRWDVPGRCAPERRQPFWGPGHGRQRGRMDRHRGAQRGATDTTSRAAAMSGNSTPMACGFVRTRVFRSTRRLPRRTSGSAARGTRSSVETRWRSHVSLLGGVAPDPSLPVMMVRGILRSS
jgi:hypothetical protein